MLANGTTYDDKTAPDAVTALEWARQTGTRIRLFYGDTATGRDWMEESDLDGTIGRSTGSLKVPLIIHSSRSTGGPYILDECIVKITTRSGRGWRTLYQHKLYLSPRLEVRPATVQGHPEYTWAVDRDGVNQANFRTAAAAKRYVARWR